MARGNGSASSPSAAGGPSRERAAPPGWDENPTAWPKRIAIAGVAFAGLCVAGYLTLYQLGLFSSVWDPFFPKGSPEVLGLTELFPDAALGVLAYGTEVVLERLS